MKPGNARRIRMRVRRSIESWTTSFAGLLSSRRRLRPQSAPVYVNLGSAFRAPDGWINLDRSVNVVIARIPGAAALMLRGGMLAPEQYERFKNGLWRRVYLWDARYPIPLPDAKAAGIYSSHFLEHLDLESAEALLAECHRILVPGGVLRIVVPDMNLIARDYVAAVDRIRRGQASPTGRLYFLSEQVEARQVSFEFAAQFFDRDPVRQHEFAHKWMWDEFSLRSALEKVGFTGVTVCPYQVGSLPNLGLLDCRPENSLHMEARKTER